ncbi:hypothetical protein FZEAL_10926, partial [Fusarium zealandicum]
MEEPSHGAPLLFCGLVGAACVSGARPIQPLNDSNIFAPASQTVQTLRAQSSPLFPESRILSYMQQESLENPEPLTHKDNPSSTPPSQHGPLHRDPSDICRVRPGDSSGAEPRSVSSIRRDHGHDVDADLLDEELRRLSLDAASAGQLPTP